MFGTIKGRVCRRIKIIPLGNVLDSTAWLFRIGYS